MMKRIYLKLFKPPLCFLPVLVMLLLFTLSASAQTSAGIIVSGTVTDSHGDALPGVNIKVKNGSTSTTSNVQGKFSLAVPSSAAVLTFTYIGFQTQEVTVGSNTLVNVTMAEKNTGLDEVVVIGYGTSKVKDLTGSVAAVNMADLSKAPVKSFDDALAGRLAGVSVVTLDGQPGSTTSIKIRGVGSITGDTSPLYVVDGFAIEGFDLNSLNPADIQSIDVLKDASATAIYGARGANGVIMVTTKRGQVGPPSVNYNMYVGFQHDINRIQVLSPYEFVKLQLEISPTLYGAEYTTGVGKTLDDYKNVAGIDWYNMVFREGVQQSHNLSISGGTDKTRYSITGSIFDQNGIIINTGYKRFQGRVTLDQNINDNLKVGITANLSSTTAFGNIANANGGYASFMPNVWGYRPIQVNPNVDITTQLQDPDIGNAPPRVNPFLQAQNAFQQTLGSPFIVNGYADYAITPELHFKVSAGVSTTNNENDQFNNSLTYAGASIVGSVKGVNGSVVTSKSTTLSNDDILTYNKSIGDHTFSILAGYSLETEKDASFGASSIYVPNESLGISGLDEGTPYSITATSGAWGLESFLGRVNYSYKTKYNFTATMRADGSSKFPNDRWGYFPSGAFAYRISDENFMKSIKFISDAKFRASYGVTGNNRVGDYAAYSSLNFTSAYYSFGNATPSQGAIANTLGNPNLKWETTAQTDLGFDLNLFNGRISFTTDYYDKITSNLLLNAALPITTGYTTATKNVGKISNSGLEFTLNTVNIASSKFQWQTSFNISFNKNKVLALTDNQESITTGVSGSAQPYYIAKIGQPVAMFYGLIYDGLYQYGDFNKTTAGTYVLKPNVPSNNTAATRGSIQPGFIKFDDLNHDGIINNNDLTIIGDPNPDFIGGFTNNFTYKNFDLNIFFQFVYGNQVMDNNILTFENGSVANTNQFAAYANRWTPTNTDTDIPRAAAGAATTNYNYSRDIEDGSYLSLKTASLGYTLPKGILSKVKVRSLRIYVSGQNLLMFTKYPGSSPDVSVRDTPLTPGFDFSSYPPSRIFVAGASLTF